MDNAQEAIPTDYISAQMAEAIAMAQDGDTIDLPNGVEDGDIFLQTLEEIGAEEAEGSENADSVTIQ